MRLRSLVLLPALLSFSVIAVGAEGGLSTSPEDAVPLSLKKGPTGENLTAKELKKLKEGDVLYALIDNEDNPVKKGVAVAVVEAPPAKVFATIGDYENFKDFMPYVAKTKVDSREPPVTTVSYWLEFPLGLSGRNYQLKLTDGTKQVDGVKVWVSDWVYTGKGNIIDTTGSWEISPWGKDHSLARYTVFTDPGGSFPTWIKNKAAGVALPKVLNAVRDRVKSPKAAPAAADETAAPAATPAPASAPAPAPAPK